MTLLSGMIDTIICLGLGLILIGTVGLVYCPLIDYLIG